MGVIRRTLPVLLAAGVLLVSLGCGGGGVAGRSQYKQDISELHDAVLSSLGEVSEGLTPGAYDDYWYLMELEELFEPSREAFVSSGKEASGIKPPPEVGPLHDDLIHYYLWGELSMDSMINGTRFFESVLPMLVDMDNLALPQLEEGAGRSEIEAASTEDRKTIQWYLKDISGMNPPAELRKYRDNLSDLFQSIDVSIGRLDQSMADDEGSALLAYQEEYAGALERVRGFWEEAMDYLNLFDVRVGFLTSWGETLSARIDEI